ncbi:hypothetical protein D3C72_1527260 [compost metagenome]
MARIQSATSPASRSSSPVTDGTRHKSNVHWASWVVVRAGMEGLRKKSLHSRDFTLPLEGGGRAAQAARWG